MGRFWTPTRRGLISGGLALAAAGPAMAWTHGVGAAPAPTPLWSADFVNGVYTVGEAPAVVGDIFAHDPDWDAWDPAVNIQDDVGWVSHGPVLTGAALTACIGGATYVVELTIPDPEAGGVQFEAELLVLPGYDAEAILLIGTGSNYRLAFSPENTHDDLVEPLNTGANKIAFTITPIHLAASVNGSAVITLDRVTPAGNGIGFYINGGLSAVDTTLTAYAVQDDSALVGLSA